MIDIAHHNISTPLEEQLVLELEVGEEHPERIDRLPGHLSFVHVRPVNENVPHVPAELSMESTRRAM